jgi:hypothetical protein
VHNVYNIFAVRPARSCEVMVNFLEPYDLLVFAERKVNYKKFNASAAQELQLLVKKAPFDISCPENRGGNIFADANGDAVIVDTEFKGDQNTGLLACYGI